MKILKMARDKDQEKKKHDAISELLPIMLEGWKQIHGTKLLEVLGGNGEVTDD